MTQGDPKGVKLQGGMHEIVTREIEIECLPNDIPEQFVMNVSELMVGQSIRASDIPLIGSMTLLSPRDTVISHVVSVKVDEAAAEAEAAAGAEPEVIKKGKKDEAHARRSGCQEEVTFGAASRVPRGPRRRGVFCIAGLGNPGSRYEATPHNAGFWVVDEVARRCRYRGHQRRKRRPVREWTVRQ